MYKCRECGKEGASDRTWGLCLKHYKMYVKIAKDAKKG
ncbi:hypothetical protein J2Z37_004901 [Ammoniphilus resinae]|uniref:Uncharacterized protein n=1 Tax=Ammoniphilus resinae TaxID=861532 RepID=A0ABS4GXA1_9BACL|nr:hypothetical protein [Ammoniphilus resinae]